MYTEIIYIPLLNEGTEVFRPAKGKKVAELIYEILEPEDYAPDDENWKFLPGTIVRCEKQVREGKERLIALAVQYPSK